MKFKDVAAVQSGQRFQKNSQAVLDGMKIWKNIKHVEGAEKIDFFLIYLKYDILMYTYIFKI